jgi:N-acetylmuramoyl-L-alanine amidase
LILSRKYAAVLLAASAGAAALAFSLRAQQAPPPSPTQSNSIAAASTLIVLDPAHGGSDTGAMLANNVAEKDVTLALASRIRGALISSGFTVVTTRDADPTDPLTTDQRAETANRTHALACIVLHATATGSGVHIYTSALQPPIADASADPTAFVPVPWDTAQSNYVAQSLNLASTLTSSLAKDHLPSLSAQAPVRPLDNLMCPAIAIELAPLVTPNSGATSPTDTAYQQQLATSLTNALRAWRDQNQPPTASTPTPTPTPTPTLDSQVAAQSRAIAAAEAAGRAAARRPPPAPALPKAQP